MSKVWKRILAVAVFAMITPVIGLVSLPTWASVKVNKTSHPDPAGNCIGE